MPDVKKIREILERLRELDVPEWALTDIEEWLHDQEVEADFGGE